MKLSLLSLTTVFSFFLFACSGPSVDPTDDDTGSLSKEMPGISDITECDPLVTEYGQLLEDYKDGLQEMIDNEELDEDAIEEWGERAEELGEKMEKKGEKTLGLKCWEQFNAIAQRYEQEIPPLAMELMQIEMKKQGIDMDMDAMMKQAQENQ